MRHSSIANVITVFSVEAVPEMRCSLHVKVLVFGLYGPQHHVVSQLFMALCFIIRPEVSDAVRPVPEHLRRTNTSVILLICLHAIA